MNIHMNLTAKGQALNAKIQAGNGNVPLEITRIVSASGTDPDPLNLENVVNMRQTAIIVRRDFLGIRASIEIMLTNQGNSSAGEPPLVTGYELSQFGMYAIDPDEGEILYRISQFDTPNYVPAAAEMGWTINPTWNFIVGNASNVIVTIDPSGMATVGQLTDHIDRLVMSQTGVHGIRFHEGWLQVWDGVDWINVAGTGSAPSGSFSITNGVLTHDVTFGTIAPNANANTLAFNTGFAAISGKTINLV